MNRRRCVSIGCPTNSLRNSAWCFECTADRIRATRRAKRIAESAARATCIAEGAATARNIRRPNTSGTSQSSPSAGEYYNVQSGTAQSGPTTGEYYNVQSGTAQSGPTTGEYYNVQTRDNLTVTFYTANSSSYTAAPITTWTTIPAGATGTAHITGTTVR